MLVIVKRACITPNIDYCVPVAFPSFTVYCCLPTCPTWCNLKLSSSLNAHFKEAGSLHTTVTLTLYDTLLCICIWLTIECLFIFTVIFTFYLGSVWFYLFDHRLTSCPKEQWSHPPTSIRCSSLEHMKRELSMVSSDQTNWTLLIWSWWLYRSHIVKHMYVKRSTYIFLGIIVANKYVCMYGVVLLWTHSHLTEKGRWCTGFWNVNSCTTVNLVGLG